MLDKGGQSKPTPAQHSVEALASLVMLTRLLEKLQEKYCILKPHKFNFLRLRRDGAEQDPHLPLPRDRGHGEKPHRSVILFQL